MQHGLGFLVLIVVLAFAVSVVQSFHLPPSLFEFSETYGGQSLNKRNFYENNQYKRKFNADDLTLRFGKRSDMAFRPDQLSLRFGR